VPDVVLDHNLSERFECRFSTVRIERSPSIMLQGMEGCVLGVWIAHGEGLHYVTVETLITAYVTIQHYNLENYVNLCHCETIKRHMNIS
jgi:phosphoribosylformylglycinamidine (FGAM) synthase-like amidotransferase family enzyme